MKISKNIFLAFLFVFSIKGEEAAQPESSQQEQQEKPERIFSPAEKYLLKGIYEEVKNEQARDRVISISLGLIFENSITLKSSTLLSASMYKECKEHIELAGGDSSKFVKCLEEKVIFYKNNPEELERQKDEKSEKFFKEHGFRL